MADLSSLEPKTRCFAVVGAFLHHWALMEAELHDAIAKALGLDKVQKYIVCKNIQFRDKINILRAVISISKFPKDQISIYDKALESIATYSNTRNMFAHDVFAATDDGLGVTFFVVKARGKLSIPDAVWKWADFDLAFSTITGHRKQLEVIVNAIATGDLQQALAAGLLAGPRGELPSPWLFGLGPPSAQGLPPPEPPGSDASPATPKRVDKTHPEPEE